MHVCIRRCPMTVTKALKDVFILARACMRMPWSRDRDRDRDCHSDRDRDSIEHFDRGTIFLPAHFQIVFSDILLLLVCVCRRSSGHKSPPEVPFVPPSHTPVFAHATPQLENRHILASEAVSQYQNP